MNVAVIIPIYGVEEYIERHAVSMFEQTFKDGICFIFIDDCSPDRSIDILNDVLARYPERQHQTYIVHQPENMGVTEARKTGVEKALSLGAKYIIHADSDDWVEKDMYLSMYKAAISQDASVVICDFVHDRFGVSTLYPQRPHNMDAETVLGMISGTGRHRMIGSLWNKLISSTLYETVDFPSGINYREDVCVLFQIFSSNPKIAYLPKAYYHYWFHTTSNIRSFSAKKYQECLDLISTLRGYKRLNSTDRYADACESACASLLYYMVKNRNGNIPDLGDEIEENIDSLKYNHQLDLLEKASVKAALKQRKAIVRIFLGMAKYNGKFKNLIRIVKSRLKYH